MIFTIEKRRFRRGGKLEETRSYYLRYRIGDMPVDKWKSLGVTDKQVADKKAHEFIQERERETAGILEPKAVRDSARKPLTAHLDDYVADLTARGRDDRGGLGVGPRRKIRRQRGGDPHRYQTHRRPKCLVHRRSPIPVFTCSQQPVFDTGPLESSVEYLAQLL